MSTPVVAPAKPAYQGTEKLLWGIVLGVVTFWLFAGTAGTVAPAIMADINKDSMILDVSSLNLAVSITSLFSGLFIVFMGGIADKYGRVKVTLLGVAMNILGSLLLVLATGALALPLLIVGRATQGFAAACIMSSSLALVKAYWDGKGRQRAVSMWSIGSWGGSGFAALFGGAVVQYIGWRGIFIIGIAISVVSFLMILGTPENKVAVKTKGFDFVGLILFIIGTSGLLIALLFYKRLGGWGDPKTLTLAGVAIVAYVLFVLFERKKTGPFIDFKLFKNTTFTGATISNFLVNATIGILIISQQLIQLAGCKVARDAAGNCPIGPNGKPQLYTAWDAGLLTIGYGVVIVAFIRVGEKLLQKFGPRKPMIWGTLIVMVTCVMLMQTQLLIGQYVILAIVAYCLFGLGLAFYATPSTDAALSNLPADQAGAGAGIYKMASSLGGAIGSAISLAVFTALAGSTPESIGDVITWTGTQSNVGYRFAGMVALGVNFLFLLLAIISIVTTVPKQTGRIAPKPEPVPDAVAAMGFIECPTCKGVGRVKAADLKGALKK